MTPHELKTLLPLSHQQKTFVDKTRQTISDIIALKDKRLLIIVGPCSIHDISLGQEYARQLKKLAEKLSTKLFIVMRTYFEKSRTFEGWKGLVNDPEINGIPDIYKGLQVSRNFLRYILELEIPTATEILDTLTQLYLQDCITWAAIGARSVESNIHRQIASGLPMPIGFKNNTEGSVLSAIFAQKFAQQSHTYLGVNDHGMMCLVESTGNPHGHIILRGGRCSPNYDQESIISTKNMLLENQLSPSIMIDCSHDNSGKNHHTQCAVLQKLTEIIPSTPSIFGLMIESHILDGNQSSITDPCISLEQTAHYLEMLYHKLP